MEHFIGGTDACTEDTVPIRRDRKNVVIGVDRIPHFGRRGFVCILAPENGPSLELAAQHGFPQYTRANYKGEESILLPRA